MIETNALLAICLTLIGDFARDVVPLPPEAVPTTAKDVRRCVVGDPHSALDVHVEHTSGTVFGVRDGTVYLFETPGSYTAAQDPRLLPRFIGDVEGVKP